MTAMREVRGSNFKNREMIRARETWPDLHEWSSTPKPRPEGLPSLFPSILSQFHCASMVSPRGPPVHNLHVRRVPSLQHTLAGP